MLLFPLLSLVLLSTAQAADGGRLRLSTSNITPDVGQEITVDVLVEDAPTIYGVDVRLTFDPALLEVVDADAETDGVQVTPGDFIDPEQSFVLQHGVDSEAGAIDYALSLLNPAPPVSGNGRLMQVTFRAKSEGQTTITITEGLYGTQTGETIAPALDGVEVEIAAEGAAGTNPVTEAIRQLSGEDDASQSLLSSLGLVALGVVGGALLVVIWLLIARSRRKRNQET